MFTIASFNGMLTRLLAGLHNACYILCQWLLVKLFFKFSTLKIQQPLPSCCLQGDLQICKCSVLYPKWPPSFCKGMVQWLILNLATSRDTGVINIQHNYCSHRCTHPVNTYKRLQPPPRLHHSLDHTIVIDMTDGVLQLEVPYTTELSIMIMEINWIPELEVALFHSMHSHKPVGKFPC